MKAELIYRHEKQSIKVYIKNADIDVLSAKYAIDKLDPESRPSKGGYPRYALLNDTEKPKRLQRFEPGSEHLVDFIFDIPEKGSLKKKLLELPAIRYYLDVTRKHDSEKEELICLQASLLEQTEDIVELSDNSIIVPFIPRPGSRVKLDEYLKISRRFNMKDAYIKAAKDYFEKLIRYDRENDEWYKNPKKEDYGPPHYWPYADHSFEQLLAWEESNMKDYDWSEEYNKGRSFNEFEGEERAQYEAFAEDWELPKPNGKPPDRQIDLNEMALFDDENYLAYKADPSIERKAIEKYYNSETKDFREKNSLY